MRIQDSGTNGIYQPPASGARSLGRLEGSNRSAYAPSPYDAGVDRVEVSDLGETLSNVMDRADTQRAAEIQKLTADYQGGRLNFDSRALARTIIDHAVATSSMSLG